MCICHYGPAFAMWVFSCLHSTLQPIEWCPLYAKFTCIHHTRDCDVFICANRTNIVGSGGRLWVHLNRWGLCLYLCIQLLLSYWRSGDRGGVFEGNENNVDLHCIAHVKVSNVEYSECTIMLCTDHVHSKFCSLCIHDRSNFSFFIYVLVMTCRQGVLRMNNVHSCMYDNLKFVPSIVVIEQLICS